MSIIEEVNKNITKSWKTKRIYLSVGIALLGIGWYFLSSYLSQDTEITEIKEYEYTVKKWDISISLSEQEWTIIWDDTVGLNFQISEKINEIYKKEWDYVKKWEIIAQLDDSILQINLQKAELWLKQAEFNLAAREDAVSYEEIQLYQEQVGSAKVSYGTTKIQWDIDVSNFKIALENAKLNYEVLAKELLLEVGQSSLLLTQQQESQNIENSLESAMLQIGQALITIETSLYDIDTLFGVTNLNGNIWWVFLSAKNSSLKNNTKAYRRSVNKNLNSYKTKRKKFSKTKNLSEVDMLLVDIISISKDTNQMLQTALLAIKVSVSSNSFSTSIISNHISQTETTIVSIKKSVDNLISSRHSIATAQQTYDTKIWTITNDLQTKVKIAKNEYEKAKIQHENAIKKAESNKNVSQKQIDIANANLSIKEQNFGSSERNLFNLSIQQAKVNVSEAKQKLLDTQIVAPCSGTIVELNGLVWEIVGLDKTTPFVKIAIDSQNHIESLIEESDISKVSIGQDVSIMVNAIDWLFFTWTVFFVADAGIEDINGIVTYKVLISYDNNKNNKIKNWMWVDIDYITKEVKNILVVPVRAVKPYNNKPHVKMNNWEYIEVIPWFTDGKMVEIMTWLNKWDIILVEEY